MSHGRLLVISDTPPGNASDLLAALARCGYDAAHCDPSELDSQADGYELLLIDQRQVEPSATAALSTAPAGNGRSAPSASSK